MATLRLTVNGKTHTVDAPRYAIAMGAARPARDDWHQHSSYCTREWMDTEQGRGK